MYMILDKGLGMKPLRSNLSAEGTDAALAIVLDGVSENWQRNVLQIRGSSTRIDVIVDGYGPVEAPAIRLSPSQARHLATQITELLGEEGAWDARTGALPRIRTAGRPV